MAAPPSAHVWLPNGWGSSRPQKLAGFSCAWYPLRHKGWTNCVFSNAITVVHTHQGMRLNDVPQGHSQNSRILIFSLWGREWPSTCGQSWMPHRVLNCEMLISLTLSWERAAICSLSAQNKRTVVVAANIYWEFTVCQAPFLVLRDLTAISCPPQENNISIPFFRQENWTQRG